MNDVIAFATDASTLHGRIHNPGDIVFVDVGERRHYAEVVRITGDGGCVIDPVSRSIVACTQPAPGAATLHASSSMLR